MQRIVFLPPFAGMAAEWHMVDAEGHRLQSGRLLPDDPPFADQVSTIAVVPGADVAVRWLDLPQGSAAQRRAAARWRLGEAVSQSLDDAVLVTGPTDAAGRTLVAAARPAMVQAWQDWLEGVGVQPQAMVPDCLCLAVPLHGLVSAPAIAGSDVLVAGEGLSLSVQADLLPLFTEGQPVTALDTEQALAALLAGAADPVVNLLDTAVTKGGYGAGWRRLAVLAACVVVSPLVLMLAGALRDEWAARQALSRAGELAVQMVPQAADAASPLEAAETILSEGPPRGGQVRMLAGLFAAVEATDGARLQDLDARGTEIRGVIRLTDTGAVQTLQRALENQGLALNPCDPVHEDGAVVCNLSVREL